MFYALGKSLYFLLFPLNWVVLLLIQALLWKRARRPLVILAIAVWYFFSLEAPLQYAYRQWEWNPELKSPQKEHYDLAIVLGGVVSYNEDLEMLNVHGGYDRILYPLQWHYEGKIDQIIISGGRSDRYHPNYNNYQMLSDFLAGDSLYQEKILVESQSLNTYQNALYCKAMIDSLNLESEHLLLVSSAIHLPRAVACFKAQGLDFDVLAVDHNQEAEAYRNWTWYWVPKPEILMKWRSLLKEMIGYHVYDWRGYF